jgi:YidC/Oxa1 family membrane protein insertase
MAHGLQGLYVLVGNYGIAIVLLTVAIRVILLPLTVSQSRSQAKMMELDADRKAIEKRYKGDKAKISEETMALYRAKGVNPLSGCLLMLVQLPFFIAFFQMLQNFDFGANPRFLIWRDLKAIDPTYILPILSGVTTWWQMKISTVSQDSSQKTMMAIMPVFVGWFSMKFSAALSLYWVATNLVSVAQQYLTPGAIPGTKKEDGLADASGGKKGQDRGGSRSGGTQRPRN